MQIGLPDRGRRVLHVGQQSTVETRWQAAQVLTAAAEESLIYGRGSGSFCPSSGPHG